jgi:hypothetical protein
MIAHEGGQLFSAAEKALVVAEFWDARAANADLVRPVFKRFPALDSEDPPPHSLRKEYCAGICSLESWNDRRASRLFGEEDDRESAVAPGYARPSGVTDVAAQLFADNLSADLFSLYMEFASITPDDDQLDKLDDEGLVAARLVELLKSQFLTVFGRV